MRNEEASLPACPGRLSRFAEIVVIDSASTDRTREIAQDFGARFVAFKWDDRYPKKRNWFLLNAPPTQPWVLFLDADEFVDDAFCDAVARALAQDDCDGYWITFYNHQRPHTAHGGQTPAVVYVNTIETDQQVQAVA